MLKRFFHALSAILLLAGAVAPMAAHASPPSRVENQLDRIDKGHRNGSINSLQYRRDLIRWHAIRQQMRADWHHNDGPMTQRQRQAIYREQNRLSERIYDQRHQRPPQ
jgi:hypothetical protein